MEISVNKHNPDDISIYYNQLSAAFRFIEANIDRRLTLEETASEACLSRYHFHRLFTLLTGETPGGYIRKRRLTSAAEKLRQSGEKIIAIALDAGYESQAAFSRAFRKQYKATPAQYRAGNNTSPFYDKKQMTETRLKHLLRNISTAPEQLTLPELGIIGISGRTSLADSSIAQLRNSFNIRRKEIEPFCDTTMEYSVSFCDDIDNFTALTDYVEFHGMNLISEPEVPEGFECRIIPPRKYMVFRHRGAFNFDIYDYIYGSWMARKKCRMNDSVFFKIERFKTVVKSGNEYNQFFEIFLPIF